MKIPPISALGRFVVQNQKKSSIKEPPFPPLQKDTISFSSSIAYYLKKYNTLPDEIKRILSPKDAIDMFRNMELVQKGALKGTKIGQGNHARVYENPWLEGYYSLIIQDPKQMSQVIYSRYGLGDSIWSDKDNELIQIIKSSKTA
ncbi:MAG: hypothetical protein IJB79_04415 [Candidatus Gastranaerophilales bacterium]|nr:hypothetical protein [Candidatus Gastranaerophilales bacterium]